MQRIDNENIDLSIIIINYNGQFWLKKLLTSLKEHYLDHTDNRIQTIIVDNDSQDNSVTLIKQEFPWVKLISSKKNIGFAAGNNLALRKVKSRYIMLLNTDTEFTKRSNLDQILQYLDNHQDAAVVSPKIELDDGSLDQACHRGEPHPWASLTYFLKLEKLFPKSKIFGQYHQLYKNLTQIHDIDACSGAAMIVRQSAIQEVGYLDERFFMYAEDLDWCKRFREAGYSIIFYPKVHILHHKYKSGIKSHSESVSKKIKAQFYETMLQYYQKHYQDRYPKVVESLIKLFIFIKKGGY